MSQTDQILNHLKRYGTIEPMKAWKLYGSYRLAARIHDIRAKGHRIDTEKVEKGKVSFARYRLVR